MVIVDKTALTLAIIGAFNWGSIGLFGFDIVAWIFGGQASIGARIIYTVVALAGIWCISVLFRSWRGITERDTDAILSCTSSDVLSFLVSL